MSRKRPPVPAQLAFDSRREEFSELPLDQRFTRIFTTNLWASDSKSGVGSELAATAGLREQLPALLAELGARSLLDLPCGDFGWLSTVPLDLAYTGADIVEALIEQNQKMYGGPGRAFRRLDLTSDPLPQVDVVLCRDCLVHLSFDNIRKALANLRRSGSTWLLTTTFLEHLENVDIEDGDWRMLNLTRPPFSLPMPERLLIEGCVEGDGAYADKALGLWRVETLSA
jgi:hypothetical protein